MNGQLIALLIRSNANLITAIDELARQIDNGKNYVEANFLNLREEVLAMADEAEAITAETEIRQEVIEASADGARHAFNQFPPMVPISPAHPLVREPLKWSDVRVGRKFAGKSANNGRDYLCVITETDVHLNSAERAVNVRTKILMFDQKEVALFDRPLPAAQFKEEFLRWIE